MREETVTSRANPLCVHVRKLGSSRAYREEQGEFLCDSPKLLEEAVRWGAAVSAVLYTGARGELAGLDQTGARLVRVSESVMRSVSPMETPQGVVFSCKIPARTAAEALRPGRYLLLEGVQDPGNVGTILRTANAFGWEVFLLEGCADLYNPKTVRSAMGAHFRSSVRRTALERAAELVREAGLPLYATALGGHTVDVREAELACCAVIIGSEGRGVSRRALELCDMSLKIPIEGCCESLNAAIAAGIVLWEGYRG